MGNEKRLLSNHLRAEIVVALTDTDDVNVMTVLELDGDVTKYYKVRLLNPGSVFCYATVDRDGDIKRIEGNTTHEAVDRFLITRFRSKMHRWDDLLGGLDDMVEAGVL